MPKETFLNLPDQKRQMIEDAAIDEFAAWGYDNASITRIVEACQIAKGLSLIHISEPTRPY